MSEALPRTVTFAITQLVCTGCPQPSIPNFTPHFRSQLRLMKEYESHIRRVATQLPFMIEAPSYQLNDDDVRYFEGILDTKNVVQDEGKLVTSNTDWMHKYKGSSKLLLQPTTADQKINFLLTNMESSVSGCRCQSGSSRGTNS
ncbi:hypothetical protein JHK82_027251 [Glycine max]|nr:hypothetical protein JHK82_027251 [Glycine max]